MSNDNPAAPAPHAADSVTDEQLSVSLGALNDPDTFHGFDVHDLIGGLHAVCVIIDHAIVDNAKFPDHNSTMGGLAQAAKVLSAILNREAHS
jgi:hypothetical protein